MKKVRWVIGALVVLIVSSIAGMYYFLSSTVPDYNGEMTAPGLTDTVTITRDSYGMPHISASNEKDAFFALGYCSAQDRLFQMDMIRRAIRGRLSEIVGKDAVDIDKLYRTITVVKSVETMYEELPPSVRETFIAYANGINYYLTHHDEKLPFEFSLLGYQPEKWKPSDCMTMLYSMAWALNFAYDEELTNAAMIDKVGGDMASEIFIDYPQGKPVILPQSFSTTSIQKTIRTVAKARAVTGALLRGGSNSWVVAGEKSITGKPLLANDMHLGMIAPSIWYEAHIHAPTLDVSGVMLAGAPLIVAGANRHVAWGFTNVMADDADYYLEKINPDDSLLCQYMGNWEPIRVFMDTIAVRDDSSVVFPIRITRHGVILDGIIDSTVRGDTSYAIAMRWTMADCGKEAQAIYMLNRAGTIDDIEKAVNFFKCPGQNWIYADDSGNIGYWAAVGIPLRNGFSGQSLLPGWDGQHEWSGYVPTEEQPHVRNPKKGWIATANNKIVPDDYPYYISHCFAPSDRIERISQLLTEKDKLGIDDFKRIQADNYLVVGRDWTPKIISAVETSRPTGKQAEALSYLQKWNYESPPDDIATTIFHATWQYLIEDIFKPRLGDSLCQYFLKENSFAVHKAMQNLMKHPDSRWFDNPETELVENMDSVLIKSFSQAIDYLDSAMGELMENWQWGKLHTLTIFHPIGRFVPFLGRLLNIGPFPVGGGSYSVNPSIYRLSNPWKMVAGSSQRYIFDLSNIDNSLRIIPTGISGNFMSPHYKDQTELWRAVTYRPFVLDSSRVEKDAANRMTMYSGNKEIKKVLIDK